ncbi:hypothetical protein TIFTF001_030416 [Ficus carica]|uniref:Uncharacterized protein n=1 Tax=Ficus carica TaxID=3494 RepID=A0AA88J3R7_FICCA|nr:hypothetical protein TIFTF001_030351 [Ficus carica]GMN61325.1 hypothetical protein TIFTF001_030416 [Ficus carica]
MKEDDREDREDREIVGAGKMVVEVVASVAWKSDLGRRGNTSGGHFGDSFVMKVAKSFVVISDGASRYGGVQIRRHRNLHGGCDWIARSTPTSTLAIPMRPVPVDLKPEIGRRFTTLPRDLSDICMSL